MPNNIETLKNIKNLPGGLRPEFTPQLLSELSRQYMQLLETGAPGVPQEMFAWMKVQLQKPGSPEAHTIDNLHPYFRDVVPVKLPDAVQIHWREYGEFFWPGTDKRVVIQPYTIEPSFPIRVFEQKRLNAKDIPLPGLISFDPFLVADGPLHRKEISLFRTLMQDYWSAVKSGNTVEKSVLEGKTAPAGLFYAGVDILQSKVLRLASVIDLLVNVQRESFDPKFLNRLYYPHILKSTERIALALQTLADKANIVIPPLCL